ncbi:hypothetical protein [Clostridium sp.]|uniref:ADP-ribosyltransferase-containing protein n=1 Tax=Clostridium sp. TaxID=1506 RepID=UPI0028437315|nr:hypothetical protein [Clostridium sp.]MDR3597073.1 hypothetical protein [Clostridium sp.]
MELNTDCISLAQIERFKHSKLRNPDNTLKVFYHGTKHNFEQFSTDFIKAEPGFWFAESEKCAVCYGDKLLKVYLDIRNPFYYEDFRDDLFTAYYSDCFCSAGYSLSQVLSFKFRDYLCDKGYDGMVLIMRGFFVAIAFYPDQIEIIK